MEDVPCNLCRSDDARLFCQATDLNQGQAGCFRFVRCGNCGLVYLNPRPGREELAGFYPADYYLDAPQSGAAGALRKRILKYKAGGTILDIGCKTGEFLAGMKDCGWDTCGVELSARAAQSARERHGLPITAADFAETHFRDAQFDVVTLWHVLEHLRDPAAALREINRIIKADGLLAIAVPNIDSFQARLFREKWFHLDAPRHFFQFSPKTLGLFLKNAGFAVQAVNHCSWQHNYVGLRMSLVYALRSQAGRPSAAPGNSAGSMRRRPTFFFDHACRFLSIFENILGRGGTIEVYARKTGRGGQ